MPSFRSQLMNEVWNPDNYSSTRTVDVYITKIREKLATSSQVSWRTKLAKLQEIDKKNATGRRFLLVYQWRLSV